MTTRTHRIATADRWRIKNPRSVCLSIIRNSIANAVNLKNAWNRKNSLVAELQAMQEQHSKALGEMEMQLARVNGQVAQGALQGRKNEICYVL